MMRIIETEIEALKQELNLLVDKDAEFSEVYELSVKLDSLILQYYKNTDKQYS